MWQADLITFFFSSLEITGYGTNEANRYGEDKTLTEDYQKDIWEFGY